VSHVAVSDEVRNDLKTGLHSPGESTAHAINGGLAWAVRRRLGPRGGEDPTNGSQSNPFTYWPVATLVTLLAHGAMRPGSFHASAPDRLASVGGAWRARPPVKPSHGGVMTMVGDSLNGAGDGGHSRRRRTARGHRGTRAALFASSAMRVGANATNRGGSRDATSGGPHTRPACGDNGLARHRVRQTGRFRAPC
jgi:hypothetical protein